MLASLAASAEVTSSARRVDRHAPREPATTEVDPGAADTVIAHPVYGTVGWLAVVNPGSRTEAATRELLRTAYRLAHSRYERRTEPTALTCFR